MTEFGQFDDFINYRGPITKMPNNGNVIPALKRHGQALCCIVVLVILGSQFKIDYLYDPAYLDEGLLYRIYYMMGCMHITIWRLFTAFSTMEVNLIANGLSYLPKNEETKTPECYNTLRAVKILKFQFGLSGLGSVLYWNMRTSDWIKYYIQMRFIDRSLPRSKVQVTPYAMAFAGSSLWHGIDVGYNVFFI